MGTTDGMDAPPEPNAASAGSANRAKEQLRVHCREVREELGQAYRDRASERICERIRQWGAFQSARVIFAYLPIRGEVDLRPLIARAPDLRWGIPRVVDTPVRHLVFHAFQSDRLLPHRYGMLEPDPALPQITPDQADLIIVPGLAYTQSGYRLGYGRGYYDRLLVKSGLAPTLGVCYQALIVGEIPHEHHDVPVGNLVTEALGVIPCRVAA